MCKIYPILTLYIKSSVWLSFLIRSLIFQFSFDRKDSNWSFFTSTVVSISPINSWTSYISFLEVETQRKASCLWLARRCDSILSIPAPRHCYQRQYVHCLLFMTRLAKDVDHLLFATEGYSLFRECSILYLPLKAKHYLLKDKGLKFFIYRWRARVCRVSLSFICLAAFDDLYFQGNECLIPLFTCSTCS